MAAAKLLPLVQEAGAVDPVCGMTVNPSTAKFRAEHGGRTYYFCCGGCQAKFTADPERYLTAAGRSKDRPLQSAAQSNTCRHATPWPRVFRPASASAHGVEYTCPMHPEVRQIGPGSCPMCGMALEPVVMTAEEPANEELADMTRRFRVSVALTVPLVLLAMSEMLPGGLGARRAAGGALRGRSCCWPRRSCCGAARRSSRAAGNRSSTAA